MNEELGIKTRVKVSLRFKFFMYVTFLIVVLIGATTIAAVTIERELMINGMEERAKTLTGILTVSSTDAIIKSDIVVLRKFVSEILSYEHDTVLEMHIFDEDGKCLASSNTAREGTVSSESIIKRVLSPDAPRILKQERDGYIDFAMRLMVRTTMKGAILLRFSLAPLERQIRKIYLTSGAIFLGAILLGALLALWLSSVVIRPIKELVAGADQVIKGNLDFKLEPRTEDETVIIAEAFNRMTSSLSRTIQELKMQAETLKQTNLQLDRKIQELSSLQELGKIISSIFNLEELLRAIIQNATVVMKSYRCSIVLVNEKTGEMYIKMAKGIDSTADITENVKISGGGAVAEYVIKTREPLLVKDLNRDERVRPVTGHTIPSGGEYRTASFVAVPLIVNEKVIGVISITDKMNGEPFNEGDVQLLTIFANQVVIAIENARLYERLVERERLEKELEIAHRIQMNMLPQKYPTVKDISISGLSLPAKEVGGDYYDFLPMSDNEIGIVIGDVSGKGVPAALMMVMIRSILRAKIMSGIPPAKIISELNAQIIDEIDPRMFITLFFAVLDLDKKTLVYTNAGHNYPVLFHADSDMITTLEDGGLLMGMFDSPEYTEGKVTLKRGDVVLFYTDGVIEAMNEKDEMYSYERLLEFVRSIRHLSAEEIKNRIVEDVTRFIGQAQQYDDITLIVIKME